MANSKNKIAFIALIIVFVVPVILAKFALEYDWFNKASTNQGELLEPIIEAQSILAEAEKKWHFIYIVPEQCDSACENAIYSVSQVRTAIGRESDRVNTLFISTEKSDAKALAKIAELGASPNVEMSATEVLQKPSENVNKVFKDVPLDAIFIADTLNNIVLKYPLTENREKAILDSRDMLLDMKKLLKLSRIG
ncbi:hypothetical protein PN836_012510 [Ningiella sp. W23]|uniref:hypothetical protein n=1 Tax=Ningiella sp. W23 TaxID=3023715 RepID=UPI003756B4AD